MTESLEVYQTWWYLYMPYMKKKVAVVSKIIYGFFGFYISVPFLILDFQYWPNHSHCHSFYTRHNLSFSRYMEFSLVAWSAHIVFIMPRDESWKYNASFWSLFHRKSAKICFLTLLCLSNLRPHVTTQRLKIDTGKIFLSFDRFRLVQIRRTIADILLVEIYLTVALSSVFAERLQQQKSVEQKLR
jgi:hypothetical protein